MKRNLFLAVIITFITVLVTGCANRYLGIGVDVSPCCAPVFTHYKTFHIVTEDTPAFLVPYIADSLVQALVEEGLVQVAAGGEVRVVVAYDQIDLVSEVPKDQFDGHLSPGGEFRFNAAVDIVMEDNDSGEKIWSARFSRIHNFYVGEYMHKERATNAIYRALKDALKQPAKQQ